MSALCCQIPSLNLMQSTGSTINSSLPMTYHFNRPNHYSYVPIQQQQVDPFIYHHQPYQQPQQQQQQQFVVPQQQQSAVSSSRARRKRLEEALTEAIPSASSGKVSQRIAQLQQSLYSATCHNPTANRVNYPLTSGGGGRPLSLDPAKDYSKPLTVDCSIEYDLPRVVRPPPGAKPLLLIARRPAPPAPLAGDSPRQWNCHPVVNPSSQQQQFIRPDCTNSTAGYYVMPVVSSSSSEDSGRGTDSERTSSPLHSHQPIVTIHHPANWAAEQQPALPAANPWILRHPLKINATVKSIRQSGSSLLLILFYSAGFFRGHFGWWGGRRRNVRDVAYAIGFIIILLGRHGHVTHPRTVTRIPHFYSTERK